MLLDTIFMQKVIDLYTYVEIACTFWAKKQEISIHRKRASLSIV